MSSSTPLVVGQGTNNNKTPVKSRRWLIWGAVFTLVIVAFMAAATRRQSTTYVNAAQVSIECPSSPAWMHATCGVTFEITDFMCKDVKEEVERRILGKDSWVDPKSHPGKYELIESQPTKTLGSRTTGDGSNYVDKFEFIYTDVEGKGCIVSGCSVAQSPSYYDYSTNYCNMRNLLCGKVDGCKVSRHDIRPPAQKFHTCPFHEVTQCTR